MARNHITTAAYTLNGISITEPSNSTDFTTEEETRHKHVTIYCELLVLFVVFYTWRTFHFFAVCLRASVKLHEILFKGITGASMFFYNKNASGRILNRFSKDIGNVDTMLPQCLLDCISVRNWF